MSEFSRVLLSAAIVAVAGSASADSGRFAMPAERISQGDRGILARNMRPEPAAAVGRAPARTRLALTVSLADADPALGLELADFMEPFVAAVGLTGQPGALVLDVRRDSAAARAGILPGDLVVSIGGEDIRDGGQLRRLMRDLDAAAVDAGIIRIGGGPDDLIAELGSAAARGNRDATLALGDVRYFNLDGRGEPAAAEDYYERAFAMGDARAAYRLGTMYATGRGVAPDLAVATRWYRLAAEAGLPAGQHALGVTWWTGRYWTGLALVGDYAEAVRLFELAAARGHAPSHLYLGLARQFGYGVDRDYAAAAASYREAALAGEVEAIVRLAEMAEAGQGAAADPVQALDLYREAARLGSIEANRRLGQKYWRGDGVLLNPITAVAYLEAAAGQGDSASMSLIAEILLSGYGVTRDEERAIDWYFRAYRAGDPEAGFALALAHADGIGVEQDMSKVAGFMLDAIRRGSSAALAEMKGNAEGWDIGVREEMQRLMQASGLYTGEIDGVFGPGTLRALDAAAAG